MTDFSRFDFAGTLRRGIRASCRTKSRRYVYKTAMGYSLGIEDKSGLVYEQWIIDGKKVLTNNNMCLDYMYGEHNGQ